MDSRGESLQPPQHHHHHHHHHHQAPPPHSQSLMMSPPPLQQHQQQQQPPPNTYNNHNNNSINPNSITASMMQQHPHHQHQHQHQQQQHQHQQQQHQQTQNPSRFPFNSDNTQYAAEGSSPSSAGFRPGGGFSIEPARKKRGRPRKYSPSPDGNSIALGLAPAPITPISTVGSGHLDSSNDGGGGGSSSNHHQNNNSGNNNNNNISQMSSDPSSGKKARGRPAGSGKKQLDALGSAGIGFTPHVIMVQTGEDIATKIMAFSQQGPRTVCILSANGAICNVTLRQPAMSGGTVTYEGRFEIISLSGSFLLSESNGNRSRHGGLSVSLAGPDGRVLGGGVAGMLVAATPVQVVVGSFIADGKKPKSGSSSAPTPNMLNFGAPVPGISPPSEGASSESSDESGSSPVNRLSAPSYNNSTTQSVQNIPMYTTNLGWPSSTMNMLPN